MSWIDEGEARMKARSWLVSYAIGEPFSFGYVIVRLHHPKTMSRTYLEALLAEIGAKQGTTQIAVIAVSPLEDGDFD
jgi:hypothetical protein